MDTSKPREIIWRKRLPAGMRQVKGTARDAGSFRYRYTDEAGKRQDVRLGWDYQRAMELYRQISDPMQRHAARVDRSITLAAYARAMLDPERPRLAVKPSTLAAYRSICALALTGSRGSSSHYAAHPMSRQPVSSITARHVEAWILDVSRLTTRRGGPIGPRTYRQALVMLSSILARAVEDGLLRTNPCARVRPPKALTPPPRIVAPTTAELQLMLRHLDATQDRLATLYQLAAETGMRRGELLALSWDDLDLPEPGDVLSPAQVHVRWTLLGIRDERGHLLRTTPKSERSIRARPISRQMVLRLRRWQSQQAELRERVGASIWDGNNPQRLVFTTRAGRPMDGANLMDHIRRISSESGAELSRSQRTQRPIRFHDLRHWWITAMLEHHKLHKVSRWAGHSSVAVTADTYAGEDPGEALEATATVELLLASGGSR